MAKGSRKGTTSVGERCPTCGQPVLGCLVCGDYAAQSGDFFIHRASHTARLNQWGVCMVCGKNATLTDKGVARHTWDHPAVLV